MKVGSALASGLDRLTRWGWSEDWNGALASPGALGMQVHCAMRNNDVRLNTCQTCAQLIDVRTLTDGGGSVQMVICERGAFT